LHQGSHWGAQAMCDLVLRKYGCIGIYTVAKQVCERCVTCKKINQKVVQKQSPGGREPGSRPFQSVQIDFTELPPIGRLKYLFFLGLVGMQLAAYPTVTATAAGVTKIILKQIIPRYEIVENINSNLKSHFTSKILQRIIENLEISWNFHTPWHPPSSGKDERMNQTIKKQLAKLALETKLPGTKCLPIALLRIRTSLRKDTGISPYEMLFGLPYMGKGDNVPQFETKDVFLKNYILGFSSSLSFLSNKGLLAQTPPLEFAVHAIQPGEGVLIKSWKEV
ncbi:TF211 protein, partial [Chordeiles acutipennis]|nr:TF211 protein [Chordeiles acutipennis]